MKTTLDPQALLSVAGKTPEASATRRDLQALRKSCRSFEAMFLQTVLKSMRKTVPEDGLFSRNNATEIFEDMRDQEIAATIAQRQSIGLAEQMFRQMESKLPKE